MRNHAAETTAATNREVSGILDQALQALGDSLKVAMKAQEETVKFWGAAVGQVNPAQALAGDWIPTAQRNADEYLRLVESSYRRNADLFKKVLHSPNGNPSAGLEKRTRDWWEASLETARDNAQDLTNTNLRVAQAWAEVLKKGAAQPAAVEK